MNTIKQWNDHSITFTYIFFLSVFLLIIGNQRSYAQGVGISESAITPDPSAILEIRSASRGLMIPRLLNSSISSPQRGLLIYDGTSDGSLLSFYNGSWITLAPLTSPSLVTPDIGAATGTSLSLTGSLTSQAATNQLVLGTGTTTTLSAAAPGSNRIYTFPDFGANGIIPIGTAGNSISFTTTGATTLTLPTTGTLLANPMTTGGDIIYGGASGIETRLPNGSSGQVLQSNGGTNPPSWTNAASGDVTLAGVQNITGAKTFSDTKLILAGATSGTTTLSATDAVTGTITLPNATSTLYGTASGSITSLQLKTSLSDEQGSGAAVFATSPTLTTPDIGVATATSVNKVALTQPATGSTLTIADGKTLTSSNTLTFTGTDGSTLAIGTGGTLGSNAYSSTAFAPLVSPSFTTPNIGAATGTSLSVTGALTAQATTNQLVLGTTNTTTFSATAPAASRVITFPDPGAPANVIYDVSSQTISGAKTFSALGTFNLGITATGAAINLNTAAGAFNTNINNGTSTGSINIGNSVSTGITQQVGTGNFSLDGTAGSAYTIGASTTTGNITVGGGSQTSGVTTILGGTGTGALGSGTSGLELIPGTAGTINIGAAGGTGAITLGSSTATQIVNIGDGSGAATVNIADGVTNAKTINIGVGAAMANTIAIGGTGANVITLGNTQAAGSISIGSAITTGTIALGGTAQTTGVTTIRGGTGAGALGAGTSGLELIPGTAGTINIGAAGGTGAITLGSSTATQIVNIGDGSGAATVNIADGVTNAKTINIGVGAAMANTIAIGGTGANVITLGNTQAAGSISIGSAITTGTIALGGTSQTTGVTTIRGGTGTGALGSATSGIALIPGTAGTINIGASAGTGTITLGASTGIQTLNLGTGTGSTATINIGTGAAGVKTVHIADATALANVITIGDNQTTAATVPVGSTKIAGANVVINGALSYGTGGGVAQTQTATITPAITGPITGQMISYKASVANTGAAPTLNVNGTGAKTVVKRAATALVAGDIALNGIYVLIYNGTQWQLLNPTAAY